jgi:hypothetical protein
MAFSDNLITSQLFYIFRILHINALLSGIEVFGSPTLGTRVFAEAPVERPL